MSTTITDALMQDIDRRYYNLCVDAKHIAANLTDAQKNQPAQFPIAFSQCYATSALNALLALKKAGEEADSIFNEVQRHYELSGPKTDQ